MDNFLDEGLVNENTAPADNGEDLLLAEIDAFRNKAAQLQQLIAAKEAQAADLQNKVADAESENKKLQEALVAKREEADTITIDVERQVEHMLQSLQVSVDGAMNEIKSAGDLNADKLSATTGTLGEKMNAVSDSLITMQAEVSEKVHSENVHLFRLLQDVLKETDRTDELIKGRDEKFKSLKTMNTVLIILVILSLGTSVASLLLNLGIF